MRNKISIRSIFSTLSRIFWPVKSHENKKVITISALMFCVLFNQSILRILKDSIIISEISVEVTNFIKVFCVFPISALFVVIYAKMVNKFSFFQIYCYLITFFVSIFLIFAFFLYPNISILHISDSKYQMLISEHPHLKWYIAMLGNWSYMIFYIFSELWPNIFYILLFWQLTNSITTVAESKRFYTIFPLFGNFSLIVVGLLIMYFASENSILKSYFFKMSNKILFIQASLVFVTLFSLLSVFLTYFICYKVGDKDITIIVDKEKPKLGLIESLKYIVSSRYLWLLLICSASFSLSMNLVESIWKSKVKELYDSVNEYARFNGLYLIWTGVLILIMTVIGNNLIRYYNWFIGAVISPLAILISGTIFFTLIVYKDIIDSFIIMSPLSIIVTAGTIQNIIAKGTKYSLLDSSLQMLYIPLDSELKTKGKAAVDILSSKLGKSSSSFVQSALFTIFPYTTYNSISFILMVLFIIVCLLWITAMKKIYHQYNAQIKN